MRGLLSSTSIIPNAIRARKSGAGASSPRRKLGVSNSKVAIGRYLLISNPDGPDGVLHEPYETTFYPHGSSRADAQVIEIERAGTHLTGMDLVLGESVTLREVVVNVHFPDGAPIDTAKVYCTGLPRRAGDLPWLFSQSTATTESSAFRHPPIASYVLRLTMPTVALSRPCIHLLTSPAFRP